ncbi:MAG TPA: hypothetical protein VGQ17_12235 [Gemmatimonadales bacterium]|jgi:hypothetical protein|nr:hypothetical protein [Gemmatimonadales bacterium]
MLAKEGRTVYAMADAARVAGGFGAVFDAAHWGTVFKNFVFSDEVLKAFPVLAELASIKNLFKHGCL